jgi:hypothetical protein
MPAAYYSKQGMEAEFSNRPMFSLHIGVPRRDMMMILNIRERRIPVEITP